MRPSEKTTFSLSAAVPQPERRTQRRHMTILRVGTIFIDGRRELCLVRNISAGGFMARVYSTLTEGDPVAVELKTDQRIEGKVSWSEGGNVGVAFNDLIDVEELLANQTTVAKGLRPRLPRVEVDRLAILRIGAHAYGVSTRDISQGGVKIESDAPFAGGEDVVLTLDKFRPVEGVIRWYDDGLCGIAFNQVIPFHELMGWLRSEPAGAGSGNRTRITSLEA